MKHYTVTAAIIHHKGEVLCMQRGKSKYDYISFKYEFPGGKVEEGEAFEAGLSRELREEMNLIVDVKSEDFFYTVQHAYPDFSIEMHSYLVKVQDRDFDRLEHHNHCWMTISELEKLDWAPADIPIVEELIKKGYV